MIRYVSLLEKQLELMLLPRGRGRFDEYLRQMVAQDASDLDLPPLVMINPMAKDHVRTQLEELIAIDADSIAQQAIEPCRRELDEEFDFNIAMVIADDAAGGWTNRYDYEFKHRFYDPRVKQRASKGRSAKRAKWQSVILWSSEPVRPQTIKQSVRAVIFRAVHQRQHGHAETLADQMKQEGGVLFRAGWDYPAFNAEELKYTREVIEPHLQADDFRTSVECLFGDIAAQSLGFTQRGLGDWAGLRLAQHDAGANERQLERASRVDGNGIGGPHKMCESCASARRSHGFTATELIDPAIWLY